MKNKELFTLRAGLNQVKRYPGVRFAIAVAKNTKAVNEEISVLEASVAPSTEFTEYEYKRMALAAQFADKNEDGSPKKFLVAPNQEHYSLTENNEVFQEAWAALKAEYGEALSRREDQKSEYLSLLEDEARVVLHRIAEDQLPESITGEELTLLEPMLDLS